MRHNAWKVNHKEGLIQPGYTLGLGIARIDEYKNIFITNWDNPSSNKLINDRGYVTQLRNNSYFIQIDHNYGIFIMPEICPYFNWGLVYPDARTSMILVRASGPDARTSIIETVNKLTYAHCKEHYFTGKWSPNLQR